ncbi:VWA domain-containing protein [Actibacterium lipolyticum]|uniref:von Willebrand factor type A domain protein n=1 Tax=Actibacterium lipolyticum TaxID=1524263 RepID=A0A238KQH5_9RHOB|nr:VWA domain-containing protein [Actibacterium lipolyticum]SMX44920.1 von Willebrand factor type A domain protein [Actibacterium lipolyticum]
MPEFADAWFLILLPLPVLVFYLVPPAVAKGAALVVPEGVGRSVVRQAKHSGGITRGRYVVPSVVWVLLVVALAGPRQLEPTPALPMSGRDLVLVLDLSGSMVRKDFAVDGETVTRLDAVKKVGAEFVRNRGGDRLGVVVFGSEAYFAAPPTFDAEAVAKTVEGMAIGISGRSTNISEGLGVALKRLDGSTAKSRVVILMSDGVNNASAANPRDVAKLASDMGVRVHTIALGPNEATGAENERGVVDVPTLQAVSDISGGQMFRVRTTEDLIVVTESIDQLEPTASAGLAAETYRDLWVYPAVLAALGCLLLAWRAPA